MVLRWGVRGVSMICNGCRVRFETWSHLGALLGFSWGPPGALSWGSLEVVLGHPWSRLGAVSKRLGALLGLFGGGSGGLIEALWACLGGLLGPSWSFSL
eukprot:9485298-Pyramimonas_sp.AAC.2